VRAKEDEGAGRRGHFIISLIKGGRKKGQLEEGQEEESMEEWEKEFLRQQEKEPTGE